MNVKYMFIEIWKVFKKKRSIYLDAQSVAELTGKSLDRGRHFRRAAHYSLNRIMKSRAKGAKIVLRKKTDDKECYIYYYGNLIRSENRGMYQCKRNPVVETVYVEIARKYKKRQRNESHEIEELYDVLEEKEITYINDKLVSL